MSSHDKALKNINYTGTHAHSHNKRGKLGELEGLKNTKHFGIKKGRMKEMRKKASELKREGKFPF